MTCFLFSFAYMAAPFILRSISYRTNIMPIAIGPVQLYPDPLAASKVTKAMLQRLEMLGTRTARAAASIYSSRVDIIEPCFSSRTRM